MKVSSNLLLSFLHDLMDWTQLKQNNFKKREQNFDLKEMFIEVAAMMEFKANLKNLYLKIECDKSMPIKVFGDNQRLM